MIPTWIQFGIIFLELSAHGTQKEKKGLISCNIRTWVTIIKPAFIFTGVSCVMHFNFLTPIKYFGHK